MPFPRMIVMIVVEVEAAIRCDAKCRDWRGRNILC